jgi:hypothetical protein
LATYRGLGDLRSSFTVSKNSLPQPFPRLDLFLSWCQFQLWLDG